ncbi:hypothetical protein [Stackebrandtia soli]|uniref:hypothetical protein n=1 Tax=Stackebrandtia soli TaxID=1892856 RepID=UPI0039E79340
MGEDVVGVGEPTSSYSLNVLLGSSQVDGAVAVVDADPRGGAAFVESSYGADACRGWGNVAVRRPRR